jgi:hypothetical protein
VGPDEKTKLVAKALAQHPHGVALTRAGKTQRDSLLRALIPLYVARAGLEHAVTSGVIQRLWLRHGLKLQATVMAKVLREHVGYSRRTKLGLQITPNGVKYVEAALAR